MAKPAKRASRLSANARDALELSKLLGAMMLAGRLKDVPRTGWVREKVANPESVADHSFRTALLCFYLAPYAGVNPEKAAVMGLVHDWHECICGDIASRPSGVVGMTLTEKKRREHEAVAKLAALLPSARSKEYVSLYAQADEQSSALGRFVKDMDVLEMCLTALEYELGKRTARDLTEFWTFAEPRFKTALGKRLFADLKAQRPPRRI